MASGQLSLTARDSGRARRLHASFFRTPPYYLQPMHSLVLTAVGRMPCCVMLAVAAVSSRGVDAHLPDAPLHVHVPTQVLQM
mmetsp:Transcript_33664/g.100243  ORF Transcript_33664/g.100243 Transcript_33664/m.100243 type:complete len:82 (-) Transcript_33664:973-1218(-)